MRLPWKRNPNSEKSCSLKFNYLDIFKLVTVWFREIYTENLWHNDESGESSLRSTESRFSWSVLFFISLLNSIKNDSEIFSSARDDEQSPRKSHFPPSFVICFSCDWQLELHAYFFLCYENKEYKFSMTNELENVSGSLRSLDVRIIVFQLKFNSNAGTRDHTAPAGSSQLTEDKILYKCEDLCRKLYSLTSYVWPSLALSRILSVSGLSITIVKMFLTPKTYLEKRAIWGRGRGSKNVSKNLVYIDAGWPG